MPKAIFARSVHRPNVMPRAFAWSLNRAHPPIERTGTFSGHYHVLGGALSPLEGIGPDELHVAELMARLSNPDITEVILATNPNVEGETTASYLARLIKPTGVTVSRLASGLPVGGDLEFADEVTLGRAIESRRIL